jgi:hypothetical protein
MVEDARENSSKKQKERELNSWALSNRTILTLQVGLIRIEQKIASFTKIA